MPNKPDKPDMPNMPNKPDKPDMPDMPDKTGKKIKKILTYVHLAYPSYPSYQAYSHVFFFRIYFFLLDFLQIGDTLYDNEYREYMKKILLILTSCFALYFCNAAPPSSLLQNVCIIKGENGSGSGFFLPFRNQWYVVTNNHVLLELKNPMILDVDGKKIDFDGAYLSPDRDLAYIPFKNYSVRGTYIRKCLRLWIRRFESAGLRRLRNR